jgi:hypothetical protein
MRSNYPLIIFILFLSLFIIRPAQAFKVEKLPLVSDVHIGVVSGVGTGLNIGFDAGFNVLGIKIGPEIEQVITDVDYSAGINATRVGGTISAWIYANWLLNYHIGMFNFQVKNRDIVVQQNGQNYTFLAGPGTYHGTYNALSLDYVWNDYLFTPKLLINLLDNGAQFKEIDFNIGRVF